ncbi:MAG TPA: phosphoribosylformylglycinamidine cyclo-ligase [Gammaproteobacteria bacterium]|nr:phosphoribosylformylglycinamidine cyclo-ligase [Gammaproteobacteria bacterium]
MTHNHQKGLTYRDAGVDINASNALIERIKPHAKRTARKESLGALGGFGAFFKIPEDYRKPVLVSGTDGVGTKLKLAIQHHRHEQIGEDLVAMCVNDLIVSNAEPLFFLDYYATGQLDVDIAEAVIASIANGCELAGCALAGGETAEMPGMYQTGDYDLAGFCVGVAEESNILDGSRVTAGDAIIGLPSSGPHSNGYSLIRKVITNAGINPIAEELPSGELLIDAVMKPTRIYVKAVLQAMATGHVSGAVHVTGGGFQENLPRSFDSDLTASIDLNSWKRPEIFKWLEAQGNVGAEEMLRTFNCGIGFILFCPPEHVTSVSQILTLAGEHPLVIGELIQRTPEPVVFSGAFT